MFNKSYVSYTGIQRMIPYNILQEVDMDSHRYGSYYANVYEFPFPEQSIIKYRDNEMRRMVTKFPLSSDSKFCQKGD